ncbi:MAG: hypothetical protein L0Z53_20180 [Acidobacteriales bacterium]|nr:hypothetical protein [Terriglobales bacterium]
MRGRISLVFGVLLTIGSDLLGQANVTPNCSEKVRQTTGPFPDYLQVIVGSGKTGSGVSWEWMREMRSRQIRRVIVDVNFTWGKEPEALLAPTMNIRGVRYFENYSEPLREIPRETVLKDAGKELEQNLAKAAEDFISWELRDILSDSQIASASGHLLYSLFDDECLPRLITSLTVWDFLDPERARVLREKLSKAPKKD